MAVRCTGAIVAAVALMRGGHRTRSVFVAFAAVAVLPMILAALSTQGGRFPVRCRCFRPTTGGTSTSRRRRSIPASASYITFIGATRGLHPDFGGDVSPGSAQVYGFPYAVVDGTQPKRAVPVPVRG